MEIIREFLPKDRYFFDFGICSLTNGYAQVDTSQDAHYFGTWANPETLTVVAYLEGDVITTKCDTEQEFIDQLRSMKRWNEEYGYRFYGIDPGLSQPVLKERFIKLGLGDLLH